MALTVKDRVKETCAAPGTGTVTLLGPVTGFAAFSRVGTGNSTYYTIADQSGTKWEVGIGTWTSGGSYGTLSRDTVYSNSAGTTALINFSSGTQDVFITAPSETFLYGYTDDGTFATSPTYSAGLGSGLTLSNNAVGIGYGVTAGLNSVAIGMGSNVTTPYFDPAIVIGKYATALSANATVVGINSLADTGSDGSVIIGFDSKATHPNTIILSASGGIYDPANSGVFIDSMRDESAGSPNKTLKYNTTTKEIFYGTGGGGSGSVTDVSVVSANGFNGTVATSTTTPAITLTTTVTGIVKGNGTALSAAAAGTDYAPATSGTSILKGNGTGGFSSASAGTDYAPATSGTSILKGNGTGGFSSASAGTDYAPATSGTSILKGNGTGGFSSASVGTDYAPATSGTSILKGNGTGGFSSASVGTDYAPATSGTSILYGNGSGGFSSVTIGSNLTFTGGTLDSVAASPFPYTNPATISQNITVTAGNNAMLVGPITVANGYSITVNTGANFVVVT